MPMSQSLYQRPRAILVYPPNQEVSPRTKHQGHFSLLACVVCQVFSPRPPPEMETKKAKGCPLGRTKLKTAQKHPLGSPALPLSGPSSLHYKHTQITVSRGGRWPWGPLKHTWQETGTL